MNDIDWGTVINNSIGAVTNIFGNPKNPQPVYIPTPGQIDTNRGNTLGVSSPMMIIGIVALFLILKK